MARLASISKFGFYPVPQHALDAAWKLVKPADFKGARGYDLTAGEGVALKFLSEKLNFTPYSNEYDERRSGLCVEKFGPLQAMTGDLFDLDISFHSGHYAWVNPPFQQSGSGTYGHTEQQFLKEQFKWLVDGAVVQFVCYTQHLSDEDMCEVIFTHMDNVIVHQVPGADLGYYKMVIVTGVVKKSSGMRKKDLLSSIELQKKAEYHYGLFKAHMANPTDTEITEELGTVFPNINDVTEPLYEIPEVKFGKLFRFSFSQKYFTDEQMVAFVHESLPRIELLNPDAINPKEENQTKRVVIPPRIKQTQALIASGLLNGLVVTTPEGLAVIRAVTRQIERQVDTTPTQIEDDPEAEVDSDGDDLGVKADVEKGEADKPDTVVTRFVTSPKTTITLLYQSGRMENIAEDDKLAEFINQNAETIFTYIQKKFVPDYTFDFVGGLLTDILGKMRVLKTDKRGKVSKNRLFAAQKHVAAAGFARLRKDNAMILAGEMGVGKTAIAASIMRLLKHEDHGEYLNIFESIAKEHQMRPDQFNIVLSPPHLVPKWVAEIKGMFPNSYVGVISSGTGVKPIIGAMEFIRGIDDQPADAMKVLVISREMVKVGEGWTPAIVHQMDYRKIAGAKGIDKDFTSESDWDHLIQGNVASPLTGEPLVKWKKGGQGTGYTITKLENNRHHSAQEYTWSGRVRRTEKQRPYPRQDSRLEQAHKSAKREDERGRHEEAHYIIKAKLDEIRDGRLDYDKRHAPIHFIWQESRDNSAAKIDVGLELAKKKGLKEKKFMIGEREIVHQPRMMPLPGVVENYLKPHDYHARFLKSPRAGIQGLAKFLATYYGDRIYLLIADEVHEYAAGDDSSQGLALLRLAAAAQKSMFMTGTLYKGVASSLYFILFAISDMVKKKYPWGHVMDFVKKMGVLERVCKVKTGTDGKNSKKETKTERVTEKPGCAPDLLELAIEFTVFLSLEEVGANIPVRHDKAVATWMTDEMAEIYRKYDKIITLYNKDRISMGDNSFMGQAFHALNNWSNWPFERYPVIHRRWLIDPDTGKRFMDSALICTIPAIKDTMTNKDRLVLDSIRDSLAKGKQVAVYFHQTGIHADKPNKDILKRFEKLVKDNIDGAIPAIMRHTVQTTKREAWLETQLAKGMNILLCNPNLVKTGLDLLWARKIIWYELDYSLPTVDQASSRAKRIGQDQETELEFYFNVMKPEKIKIEAVIDDYGDGVKLIKEFEIGPDLDNLVPAPQSADDMMNAVIGDVLAMSGMSWDDEVLPAEVPYDDTDWDGNPINTSWEYDEPMSDVPDPFSEPIMVESLTPIGAFEFNTIEAQGILIVDRKRKAARFLYGQGGGSLASVEAESKTLVEELAEMAGQAAKVMSASALFEAAVAAEAIDLEMSSDVEVEAVLEDLPSGFKVSQVRKARKSWKPAKKNYIPNMEKYNELLGIIVEVSPIAAPVELPVVEEAPEMVFEEPAPIPQPTYKTVHLEMAMREPKWKADYAKFGKPTERPATQPGETNSWVYSAGDNKFVVWLKTFDNTVERRSMIQEGDNFAIVGVVSYK